VLPGGSAFTIVVGVTAVGIVVGRSQRHRTDHLREPMGALQGALLGFIIPGSSAAQRAIARGDEIQKQLWALVTFDLDRPTRGWIRVPATALSQLRASMEAPPAAAAP
jgi:nucleotide-binding universal stress UspA family protein